jgi:hypothetical protein
MSDSDRLTSACSFPTTHWSAVARAVASAEDHGAARRRALADLLHRYLPAMKAFLVLDRRLDPHRCDDLLQGFVAEMVLERNLLARADQGRGRFRTFLLACLSRYVAMQHRYNNAAMRHPGDRQLLTLSDDAAETIGQSCPSDAFDVAWGRQVIADALDRMRKECDESLRPDLWALFEGRVVRPAMENIPPLDYEQLQKRFGFETPSQATNALVTAKRMFTRVLRCVVAEYADGEEVDQELIHLRKILAGAGSPSRLHR